MDAIFSTVQDTFKSVTTTENVEIEFRFGKINNTMFDTNVGKDIFEKVLRGLNKYSSWESVLKSNTSVYYKGTVRMSINDENENDVNIINKKNITKKDFKLSEHIMDVRMAVSAETILPTSCRPGEDDIMDFIRVKNRVSFIRKNLRIDMTIVQGDTCDMDDEDENRYEIELEIIDPRFVTDEKLLYNITNKIFDILKIVE